jgi:rhomboid family GlyGly-CTERM serine protease
MSRGARGWVALAAFSALMALATTLVTTLDSPPGGPAWAALLDWQPRLAWSQPWRWWTAAWVHHGNAHLAVNLAGCAVLIALGAAARLGYRWTLAWCAAWPATHLALLLQPAMTHYGGLSGVLHAGVAVTAVALVASPPEDPDRMRRRRTGWLIGAALLIKLALEKPWLAELQPAPWLGVSVAPLAHASGAACGALAAGIVALAHARSQR